MADRKISDLAELTQPAAGDYLPIVDISEPTTAGKNKRILFSTLLSRLVSGTASAPALAPLNDTSTGIYFPAGGQIAFSTSGTFRAMFADGEYRVGHTGSTPSPAGVALSPAGVVRIGNNAQASGWGFASFYRSNVFIGSISQSGTTGVSYNTSSDYRLKDNVEPLTGAIARLQQLKPSRFNFIADPDRTVDGFLAHEAQEVVPEAVTGEKDGEEMQGIDQAKLVPLLTAALQEAIARIEALEAEVGRLSQ